MGSQQEERAKVKVHTCEPLGVTYSSLRGKTSIGWKAEGWGGSRISTG